MTFRASVDPPPPPPGRKCARIMCVTVDRFGFWAESGRTFRRSWRSWKSRGVASHARADSIDAVAGRGGEAHGRRRGASAGPPRADARRARSGSGRGRGGASAGGRPTRSRWRAPSTCWTACVGEVGRNYTLLRSKETKAKRRKRNTLPLEWPDPALKVRDRARFTHTVPPVLHNSGPHSSCRPPQHSKEQGAKRNKQGHNITTDDRR